MTREKEPCLQKMKSVSSQATLCYRADLRLPLCRWFITHYSVRLRLLEKANKKDVLKSNLASYSISWGKGTNDIWPPSNFLSIQVRVQVFKLVVFADSNNLSTAVLRPDWNWAAVHRSSCFEYIIKVHARSETAMHNITTFTPCTAILFKGAVSRYSVIFCAFLRGQKWRLLAQVSRTSDHDSSVSRANSFIVQAESRKCRFPQAIVVFRGLPCGSHYISPHKMAAKYHRLSWHCRFKVVLSANWAFWRNIPLSVQVGFKEVRGSFAILFWLPCATWHRVMTHTHHTQSFRSTDAFLRHSTPGHIRGHLRVSSSPQWTFFRFPGTMHGLHSNEQKT